MFRAVVASAVIHSVSLCLAIFGYGATVGWIGGVLSLGWAFLLFLLLLLLAFVLWLLFGTVALAGLGAPAAVAIVLAAVAALGVADRAPAQTAAQEVESVPATRPIDVAVVSEPEASHQRSAPDPKAPAAPKMFSAAFGASEGQGLEKIGATVRGKLWTVTLPSAAVSAAEQTVGDALSRRTVASEKSAHTAPTDESAQTAALHGIAPAERRGEAQHDETARQEISKGVQDGIKGVMDRLAKAMPRLAELQARRQQAAAGKQSSQQRDRVVQTVQASVASKAFRTPSAVPMQGRDSESRESILPRLAARADEGFSHAQFNLAEVLLERAESSARPAADLARARELLERAALDRYMPAQVLLAVIESEGDAQRAPNLPAAHAWLSAAAAQGSEAAERARDELAREFRDGDAVKAAVAAARLKNLMTRVARTAGSDGNRAELNEQLRHAAVLGDSEAVHVLLARNADADDADQEGRTPLIEAAWRGYSRIVEALVRAGAKLDARDDSGKNAVAWAAINGHAGVIARMVDAGARVDLPDADGFTPLMRAAWNGHTAAVEALLSAGARADVRNRHGRSAADYAREQGNARVLSALAEARY